MTAPAIILKRPYIVNLHGTCNRALTFQNYMVNAIEHSLFRISVTSNK
jgi:hypothetical protein